MNNYPIPEYLYVSCYFDCLIKSNKTNTENNVLRFYEAMKIGIQHAEMKEKTYNPADEEFFKHSWKDERVRKIKAISAKIFDKNLSIDDFIILLKHEYQISRVMDIT